MDTQEFQSEKKKKKSHLEIVFTINDISVNIKFNIVRIW